MAKMNNEKYSLLFLVFHFCVYLYALTALGEQGTAFGGPRHVGITWKHAFLFLGLP
jgi:hypothetical protein